MPKLTCSMCGRVEEVPKWHPQLAHDPDAAEAPTYVCQTCQDRVRAEAVGQQGPDSGQG